MSISPDNVGRKALELCPSTTLDGLIHQRLVGPVIFIGNRCITGRDQVPAYSSSVDAAVSLVARLLPDWTWCLRGGARSACVELASASGQGLAVTCPDTERHLGLLTCIALFAVLDATLHGGSLDQERGEAALLNLLKLPSDEFGRRAIPLIQFP